MQKFERIAMSFFALAAGAFCFLAIPKPAVGQASNYRPGVTPPKVDLPAEVTLSAKFPTHPAVGLFARKCNIDTVQNDLFLFAEESVVGVKVTPQPREFAFDVEFIIRNEQGGAKFETAGSLSDGGTTPTVVVLPKGIQRVHVRGIARKEKNGVALIRCLPGTPWYLISAKVRR